MTIMHLAFAVAVPGLTSATASNLQLRADWKAAFASQPREFVSPVNLECIAGEPPAELLGGTLFKNGPANFERGDTCFAHWLDGDGFVTRLSISSSDGSATWSGRYVNTEAYAEEEAANDVKYRTTFGTQRPGGILNNLMDIRLKSPANTNVLPLPGGHAVLALWEAGPPYELDPTTLECRGPHSLDGRLRLSPAHGALPGTVGNGAVDRALERLGLLTDALSAHPREDDWAAQRTIAWSWRQRLVGPPAIEVALHAIQYDAQGAGTASTADPPSPPVRATLTDVPFAPHDMALSSSFGVFISSPTRVDITPFILGLRGPAQCTRFDPATTLGPDATSRIHLVDRTGQQSGGASSPVVAGSTGHDPMDAAPPLDALAVDIGAPFHPVHMATAWEEENDPPTEFTEGGEAVGTAVEVLASCWPPQAVQRLARTGSSLLGSWEELVQGDFSGVPMTNLVRFRVDREAKCVVRASILASGAQFDHPSVHPHYVTRRVRFVFGTLGRCDNGGDTDATPEPPQKFGCIDLDANDGDGVLVDSWYAGDRRLVDEAVLVPMDADYGNSHDAERQRACWLLAPIFDGETKRTSYVVLDGRNLKRGPVCEWVLPTFVPWGLHGAWTTQAQQR